MSHYNTQNSGLIQRLNYYCIIVQVGLLRFHVIDLAASLRNIIRQTGQESTQS